MVWCYNRHFTRFIIIICAVNWAEMPKYVTEWMEWIETKKNCKILIQKKIFEIYYKIKMNWFRWFMPKYCKKKKQKTNGMSIILYSHVISLWYVKLILCIQFVALWAILIRFHLMFQMDHLQNLTITYRANDIMCTILKLLITRIRLFCHFFFSHLTCHICMLCMLKHQPIE